MDRGLTIVHCNRWVVSNYILIYPLITLMYTEIKLIKWLISVKVHVKVQLRNL